MCSHLSVREGARVYACVCNPPSAAGSLRPCWVLSQGIGTDALPVRLRIKEAFSHNRSLVNMGAVGVGGAPDLCGSSVVQSDTMQSLVGLPRPPQGHFTRPLIRLGPLKGLVPNDSLSHMFAHLPETALLMQGHILLIRLLQLIHNQPYSNRG